MKSIRKLEYICEACAYSFEVYDDYEFADDILCEQCNLVEQTLKLEDNILILKNVNIELLSQIDYLKEKLVEVRNARDEFIEKVCIANHQFDNVNHKFQIAKSVLELIGKRQLESWSVMYENLCESALKEIEELK